MINGSRWGRILLAVVAASAACSASDVLSAQVHRPASQFTTFYPKHGGGKRPAVLVLGGAEGGDKWARAVAARLAEHGYTALAQAYFNSPGLDAQLLEIPLEQLKQGIDRLIDDSHVDPRRIAVLGLSKGAEAALLLASSDPRIRAVVAGSPSDVVWQGIDRKAGMVKSSWTSSGRPLAFVPFAACADCLSLGALYTKSREFPERLVAAAIPIERARGPIMLLASTNDAVWPSETMAKALQFRLKQHKFRHPVILLRYPEGGHFTLGPTDQENAKSDAEFGGGTPDGVVAARRDSWPRVLAFLDKTFHYTPSAE